MPRKKEPRFELKGVDDLFTTQEVRDERKLPRIRELPIDQIADFPDHPYKVRDDEDMMDLMESIRENGVLTPVTVRKIPGGTFEMISGHRRKRACELLGYKTIRGEVVDLDKDTAVIMMCDSNLQRTTILPSEKAFAYKMRLEAMNRQGKRSDLTSTPLGSKLRANEELGHAVGESREQIRRYIRLTELIPAILELQEELLENMEMEACTPSHDQTIRMRKLLSDGKLTAEAITAVMQEEKPNQKERIVLRDDRTRKLLPKDLPAAERESYIIQALEFYAKHRARQKERDRER